MEENIQKHIVFQKMVALAFLFCAPFVSFAVTIDDGMSRQIVERCEKTYDRRHQELKDMANANFSMIDRYLTVMSLLFAVFGVIVTVVPMASAWRASKSIREDRERWDRTFADMQEQLKKNGDVMVRNASAELYFHLAKMCFEQYKVNPSYPLFKMAFFELVKSMEANAAISNSMGLNSVISFANIMLCKSCDDKSMRCDRSPIPPSIVSDRTTLKNDLRQWSWPIQLHRLLFILESDEIEREKRKWSSDNIVRIYQNFGKQPS